MAIIKRVDVPRPGMYLLAEDIALDATKKHAVPADAPDARFVLGSAGTEISATVAAGLSNVEIKDQRVSIAKMSAESEPATTGPVPSRAAAPEIEAPLDPAGEQPSVTEGEPISLADIDAGTREPPKTDKPKKAEGK